MVDWAGVAVMRVAAASLLVGVEAAEEPAGAGSLVAQADSRAKVATAMSVE
jgi:hypothetical protein